LSDVALERCDGSRDAIFGADPDTQLSRTKLHLGIASCGAHRSRKIVG
jgi:hypothetical protein